MITTKALAASLGYTRSRTIVNKNHNHKAIKGSGTCSVCWGVFKTHASDGTLHLHGPRSSPCTGSNQRPASAGTPHVTGGSDATVTATSDNNCIQSATVIASSVSTLPVQYDKRNWSHPSYRGPLVKRIPRSARLTCANSISDLIKSILQQPENIDGWADLLTFGSFILLKPRRGGNKCNLT